MSIESNLNLAQVDFTQEELSLLLRLSRATLPQFQPTHLDDAQRKAALRSLYARSIVFSDANGPFTVHEGVVLLLTAGVHAHCVTQMDSTLQKSRDILYQLDDIVVRQSQFRKGIHRFQVLDTPNKLVSILNHLLNAQPSPNPITAEDSHLISKTKWEAILKGTWTNELPSSLYEALKVPSVIIDMKTLAIQNKPPQAPSDLFVVGHPDGGYWLAKSQKDGVLLQVVQHSDAVKLMVNLITPQLIQPNPYDWA